MVPAIADLYYSMLCDLLMATSGPYDSQVAESHIDVGFRHWVQNGVDVGLSRSQLWSVVCCGFEKGSWCGAMRYMVRDMDAWGNKRRRSFNGRACWYTLLLARVTSLAWICWFEYFLEFLFWLRALWRSSMGQHGMSCTKFVQNPILSYYRTIVSWIFHVATEGLWSLAGV